MARYAEVEDVVEWLELEAPDHDVIADALETASRNLEGVAGWSFFPNGDGPNTSGTAARVYVPHSDLLCVFDCVTETDPTDLTVKVDTGLDGSFSTTWTSGTHYQAEPLNRLRNGNTFPYHKLRAIRGNCFPQAGGHATVQVTGTYGWSAIPTSVKQACLIEASRLLGRRRGIEGVIGFEGGGVANLARDIDRDALAKLEPYLKPNHGVAPRG